MEKKIIQFDVTHDGMRIDTALSKILGVSRNFVQHLIARNAIISGVKGIKKSDRVYDTQEVQVIDMNRFDDDSCLQEAPRIVLPILYQCDDYAIIYKPKGVYSHPTSIREIGQPSVVGFLYHYFGSIPSIGTFIRAGLMHRLDRDTDGLMIVALSEQGLKHFSALFHEKSTATSIEEKNTVMLKKYYRCLIQPSYQSAYDQLVLLQYQLPYCISVPVCAKVPGAIQKDAVSIIHGLQLQGNRVWCELEILTGRTHQIRIHCAQVLHAPIVGDYLYGNTKTSDYLHLTAYKLLFQTLGGGIQEYELQGNRHDSVGTRIFVLNGQQHYLVEQDGQYLVTNM